MYIRCALVAPLWCMPLSAHAEMMVASFYSPRTPNIAAHRTLPFGTRLIVTNQRNGRSVHVVIRDRGPFIRGRSLDVSRAHAKKLGFERSGVARLSTRIVRRSSR
jgi:rare lipoprotein A